MWVVSRFTTTYEVAAALRIAVAVAIAAAAAPLSTAGVFFLSACQDDVGADEARRGLVIHRQFHQDGAPSAAIQWTTSRDVTVS
jgi:hypothetical protein